MQRWRTLTGVILEGGNRGFLRKRMRMIHRGRGPSNDWLVTLYGWGIGAIVLAMIVFAITFLVGG